MAFMRAAQDASHKSHGLYGTISVGCTKKSFLKQLTGKTKEETLLKQTQNFSCTQKHFFFLNKQVLDQEKNVIGNHRNHRSLAVCVLHLAGCHAQGVSWPHKSFLLYCIRTRDENGRNGWENLSTVSVSVFYYGKREPEQNRREQERKRDIQVTEMGGNRKVYRNALLFNHHSAWINITLYTLLRKLFF